MPALLAVIGGDSRPFEREMRAIQRIAHRTGDTIKDELGGKLAAVASAATLEEAARRTIEYGGHIEDLSDRLGIGTEAVQAWDFALQQAGSSIESAAGFFEKLAESRQKALAGNEEAITSYRRLGVSIKDLQTLRLEELGLKIATSFQGGDPQKLLADLRNVGGRAAGDLAAAFRSGFAEAVDGAKDLGVIISDDVIAKLDAVGDQFATLGAEMRASFAPAIGWAADLAQGLWRNLQRAGVAMVTLPLFGLKAAREESAELEAKWKAQDDQAAKDRASRKKGFVGGGDDTTEDSRAAAREAEKILRLRQQLYDLQQQGDLKALDREGQMLELLRRRAEILKAMAQSKTEEGKLNAAIDVEKIDAEIRSISKEAEKDPSNPRFARGELTTYQKQGAYASASDSQMLDTTRRSERHLADIKQILSQRSSAGGQRPFGETVY